MWEPYVFENAGEMVMYRTSMMVMVISVSPWMRSGMSRSGLQNTFGFSRGSLSNQENITSSAIVFCF